jgi:serine/threonine protein kinase/Flp pilus assembly protein TadD
MIGKTISHYKILEKLGEGGMGVVYKAQDTKLDRIVALKFLPKSLVCDAEAKSRFEHEAKAASSLNHPNITTIHEIDEFESECFIVMEYVEGKSLKELLKSKPLSLKEVLDIAIQIGEGLNAAHKKEIVHRDIKSDNLMLTNDGLVKIMDFGLAKLKGVNKLTKTGSTLGTMQYMSPEQAKGEEVDQRSDIFSFGVVLYELLTKQLPFEGEHPAAIIYSIINEQPQPLARYNNQVSSELERIVFKALAKDKEERYQHIDDLLADLKHEKKSLEYVKTGQIPKEVLLPKPKKKILPIMIPTSVIFILVLLFLIFKPFKFEIGTEKKASAEENSLAIMYFENLVDREDKERLGEIVTNLLITSLSESQYMRVVSSQRLYDILKLLGKEGAKVIDRNVATEVANKANAKWMLLGNILQVEPRMVITTQLVEVKSGQVKGSQRITGEIKEDVFTLVDKLIPALKKDLSLPAQAQKEETPKVADVTTHSPEAYRYYLEGMDYDYKEYKIEAKRSYKKALELDSTFAMAYYRLSWIETGEERKRLIAKAVRYSNKVSQKEKLYIQAWAVRISRNYTQYIKELQKITEQYPEDKEVLLLLGVFNAEVLRQPANSLHYYNKAIEIDPLYKVAYNQLAYAYNALGDLEKSIWAINKYISLAPDEPNPYDTRGDLYAWNCKLDQAIESYRKAIEIKPDFYMSLAKLGHMYFFRRQYAKAESCYEDLCSSTDKSTRSEGRVYLALIPAYQGRFDNALRILDDGIVADRMDQAEPSWNIQKHWEKAFIYDAKENLDLALKEAKIIIEINKRVYPNSPMNGRDLYAYLLAKSEKLKEAEEINQALKKDIEAKSPASIYDYWLALGTVGLVQGNSKNAVTYLEKAEKEGPPLIVVRFFLAQAYLELGRLGEAVTLLEQALSRYDDVRAIQPIYAVKCCYLLSLAYEKSGWTNKAIKQYEEFLDIWKNADPGIPEVVDAKERLNKLKKNL